MMSVRRLLPLAVALMLATVATSPAPARQPRVSAQPGCPPELVAPLQGAGSLTCRPSAGGLVVAVRSRNPRLGEPCEDVRYERAEFVVSSGEVSARFALFGGLSQGTLTLTPDEARMLSAWDAYIAEVQLGTYERASGGGSLACRLNPTFHFDCPAAHMLDELCLVWEATTSTHQKRGSEKER